jgi:hypothetical protein
MFCTGSYIDQGIDLPPHYLVVVTKSHHSESSYFINYYLHHTRNLIFLSIQ